MPTGILLDIEGTTSSISFVHDVMFPFALDHLAGFLAEHFDRTDVRQACDTIAQDAGYDSLAAWSAQEPGVPASELVQRQVRQLMAEDVKATGLKQLQGLIWQGGFESGQLQAHVYPDVIPAITRWKAEGKDVRIYSSGSVVAQKLFFGHVDGAGNCLPLFSGHYDTTIGGKKDAASYQRIAEDWGLAPADILFVSDVGEELLAAQSAGLQVAASLRPGNAPLSAAYAGPTISSFDELSNAQDSL